MTSPTTNTVTDELVEKLARLIAPSWWTDLLPDGQHVLNNYPFQHVRYREASLTTARGFLTAALSTHPHTGMEDRATAREGK